MSVLYIIQNFIFSDYLSPIIKNDRYPSFYYLLTINIFVPYYKNKYYTIQKQLYRLCSCFQNVKDKVVSSSTVICLCKNVDTFL